jgi:hypothetical protein
MVTFFPGKYSGIVAPLHPMDVESTCVFVGIRDHVIAVEVVVAT